MSSLLYYPAPEVRDILFPVQQRKFATVSRSRGGGRRYS